MPKTMKNGTYKHGDYTISYNLSLILYSKLWVASKNAPIIFYCKLII